jgi:hypothetical protein
VSSVGSEASSAAASERLESLRHAAHIAVGSFSLARSEAREAVGSYAQVGARCGRGGGGGPPGRGWGGWGGGGGGGGREHARTHMDAYGCMVHTDCPLPAPPPHPTHIHTYIRTLFLPLSLSLCLFPCV